MSPVPARHVWALSTVGTKRHIVDKGRAKCQWYVVLGLSHNTPEVLAVPACKRCLQITGGAE